MRYKILFLSAFIFAATLIRIEAKAFFRTDIYTALSSENLELIEAQIKVVRTSSFPEKQAYEGALLMKKSGLLKGLPKEKLVIFKEGRTKLEAAIAKDKDNIEYRFLRLIIQEHAPKIVKYRSEIDADSQLVRTQYKSLPDYLQKCVADYARHSKVLKLS